MLNKRTVESLIKAGAFDTLGHRRKGLLQVFEQIIDATLQRRRERDQGVMSLFGDLLADGDGYSERVAIPDVEFDKVQRLRFEKEMLGLYVSRPPAAGLTRRRCAARPTAAIAELDERQDGEIAHRRWGRHRTSSASSPRRATRWRCSSSRTCRIGRGHGLPRAMQDHGYKLADDAVVLRQGPRRQAGRDPEADRAWRSPCSRASPTPPRRCGSTCPPRCSREERIDRLKRLLAEHPGESPVFLHLGEGKVLRLPDEYRVDLPRVVGELRVAFGHDAVVL